MKDSTKVGGDDEFEKRNKKFIRLMSDDKQFRKNSRQWFDKAFGYEYLYHFRWLGLPIIQFPQDLIVLQEIIWNVKPDLIIETGIARGGSLIFYASMLELIGKGKVVGIDIDIRQHNKKEIMKHPFYKRITMIQGSSIDKTVAQQVAKFAENKKKVMVILDSNHTHDHVLEELSLYSPLVTKDCYLVVFDTMIDDMPNKMFNNRPWGKGNNPKTAVMNFLKRNKRFKMDKDIEKKLIVTSTPYGFLKCVKQ